jgi:hypothetical protein
MAFSIIPSMNPAPSPSRILLLAGKRTTLNGSGRSAVQRYRLARARLQAPPAFGQSSAGDPARSKRSANLVIP